MASTQQLSGFNPISHSTTANLVKATNRVDQTNNSNLATQSHTSSSVQSTTTNQQDKATTVVNWWQPPSKDSSDSSEIFMEDTWDDYVFPELEDDEISISSFEDDQDWEPTEVDPPTFPVALDPNTADYVNEDAAMMDLDMPSYQLSFWDQMEMGLDYVIVNKGDNSQPNPTMLSKENMSIIPSPYAHGYPVLRALDVDTETDDEDEVLMKPSQSELYY